VHAGFAPLRGEYLLYEFTKGSHLGDPRPAILLAAATVVLALLVAGVRRAAIVAAVLALANGTAVLLAANASVARPPLPDPHLWPSNHTTAVAAAGFCLPLIFTGRLRYPAALLAFGMSAGITLMLIIRGTHLLSDLVGAVLVAGLWAVVGAELDRRLRK
jgi:membrane-associated phospholipid phosphatase